MTPGEGHSSQRGLRDTRAETAGRPAVPMGGEEGVAGDRMETEADRRWGCWSRVPLPHQHSGSCWAGVTGRGREADTASPERADWRDQNTAWRIGSRPRLLWAIPGASRAAWLWLWREMERPQEVLGEGVKGLHSRQGTRYTGHSTPRLHSPWPETCSRRVTRGHPPATRPLQGGLAPFSALYSLPQVDQSSQGPELLMNTKL